MDADTTADVLFLAADATAYFCVILIAAVAVGSRWDAPWNKYDAIACSSREFSDNVTAAIALAHLICSRNACIVPF